MVCLILGSSGFLGSYLSSYLESRGHKVLTFDIKESNDEDLRIPNNNVLLKLIEVSDFVYFVAFDVGNGEYLEKNDTNFSFISNNISIIQNTFSVLQKTRKPFIFISSAMSIIVDSTYGLLKRVGEKYTKSLNGLNVRIWNIYGEELKSEKSHCITDFIHGACYNDQIIIKTTGKERRQFLHVEDCCEALYLLTMNYDIIDREEMLDLTSFKWVRIKCLANRIKRIVKNIDISCGRYDGIQYPNMIPSKYILKFWKPKIDLTMGLTELVLNKSHPSEALTKIEATQRQDVN